jgi:osmotically inducible protein OsmC
MCAIPAVWAMPRVKGKDDLTRYAKPGFMLPAPQRRLRSVRVKNRNLSPKTHSFKERHTMAIRTGNAVWEGNLQNGKGNLKLGSGAYEGPYSFLSRFQDAAGTNPEEMIAAAHAACYSMALSHGLDQAGHTPTRVSTKAKAHLEKGDGGFSITKIELETEAEVPGIDEAKFQELAVETKSACPVSKALAATPITLSAKLLTSSVA